MDLILFSALIYLGGKKKEKKGFLCSIFLDN